MKICIIFIQKTSFLHINLYKYIITIKSKPINHYGFKMCDGYFGEPRRTRFELRVVTKDDGLFYVYMVTIYDDDKDEKEVLPFAQPLTIPKASLEELKKYLKEQLDACEKPVINNAIFPKEPVVQRSYFN